MLSHKGLFTFMNKKLLIFLAVIAFTFGYTIYESMKLDKKLAAQSSIRTGAIIKSYPKYIKFKDLFDKKVFDQKSIFDGKSKIIVHFWATWCGPCELEFPELVELTAKLKGDPSIKFVFVAVNDELKKIQKFLKKFNLEANTIVLKDDNNGFKSFGTYKLPETYIFGADGKVIKKYSGQQAWASDTLVNYFKSL